MINFLVNSYLSLYNIIFYVSIVLLIVVFFALRTIKIKSKTAGKKRFVLTFIFLLIIYSFIPYYYENRARNYLQHPPRNIDKAIEYRTTAAKLSINPFEKNMLYNHLASLYYIKKDYQTAVDVHKKGCKIINNQELVSTIIISKAYAKLGNYDEAIKILLNKNNTEHNELNKMVLYSSISAIFMELKAYKISYNYVNEYFKIYNKHRCMMMQPPCVMVKRRADLSKKISRFDLAKKDEIYLNKYCK